MATAPRLTLPPISALFQDPFSSDNHEIPLKDENQGSRCELKAYDARLNAKGDRIYLHAGTKRSFDPQTSIENHESALVQTKFYDWEGDLSYIETEVRSPHIKEALMEVVREDYPDLAIKSEKLVMKNFKQCLFHYHKELREYGKTLDDPVAANHLDFALQHLYKELGHEMQIFQHNVEAEGVEPRLDFFNLWMAFKPGDLVRQKIRDIDCVYRIVNTKYERSLFWAPNFRITLSSLDFDGDCFGYTTTSGIIGSSSCPGFTRLKDLPINPLRHVPKKERRAIMDSALARGKRFIELSSTIHHCEYSGIADILTHYLEEEHEGYESKHIMVKGRVMIDGKQFSLMRPAGSPNLLYSQPKYDVKSNRHKDIPHEELAISSHQVMGFSLANKKWGFFRIELVQDIEYNDNAFDQLILPRLQKDMVKALIAAHGREKIVFDDIIKDKGKGMTILLHGTQGVGKTLTAESVAEHLKRPLYSITAGDFAMDTATTEKQLTEILDLASHWNAVLLIDEADVFLEQRRFSDMKRNAIVSVFLRVLEYYGGVLILTTNRVTTIDSAFKSRIHLGIKYHPLSAEARRGLWQFFISKAIGQHEHVNWLNNTVLGDLASHKFNGRVIKNAVRMAHALAVNEDATLDLSHLRSAVEAMTLFEKDLLENDMEENMEAFPAAEDEFEPRTTRPNKRRRTDG